MALGNTTQEDPSSEEMDGKVTTASGSNDDTGEQNTLAPPGICDICAEFYHFLVSGKCLPNNKMCLE